jgi:hypothetical protein
MAHFLLADSLCCALSGAMTFDVLFPCLAHNPRHAAIRVGRNTFGRVPEFVFHSQSASRCIHAAMKTDDFEFPNDMVIPFITNAFVDLRLVETFVSGAKSTKGDSSRLKSSRSRVYIVFLPVLCTPSGVRPCRNQFYLQQSKKKFAVTIFHILRTNRHRLRRASLLRDARPVERGSIPSVQITGRNFHGNFRSKA